MNRRSFLKCLSSGAVASTLLPSISFADTDSPEIAITMDDPHTLASGPLSNDQLSNNILDAFSRNNNLKIALFVNAGRVDSEEGKALIDKFDSAGHMICNHSYSHYNYHSDRITYKQYSEDFLRCDSYIKLFKSYRRLFRYPLLREGNTLEKRDQMRALLDKHSYRNGYVTVDNSDWLIDRLLRNELGKDPSLVLENVKQFYVKHMIEQAAIYNEMAQKLYSRNVKQTLLTHFNLVNALFLGDLIKEFINLGWEVIDAPEAYSDPVFMEKPDIIPTGDSLIKALARESTSFDAIPDPPGENEDFVEREFLAAIAEKH
ncbi:MAG: polysaccharide deacetylase family protein [Chlorobiales bacterium]|nr:polysaccharide deacetylase family protein [Chlorobiales bacterium]